MSVDLGQSDFKVKFDLYSYFFICSFIYSCSYLQKYSSFSVNKIRKHFEQGGKKPLLKALDDASFSVYEGQITALLGPNGAGKSTLISILTGMLKPSGGRADFYGLDITDTNDMNDIRKIIGKHY